MNQRAMAGVITEVHSLVDLILKSATFATQLRQGFYRASRELEDFPVLVNSLRRKHKMWESLLRRNGMSADEFARPELEAAVGVLDREASRIEGMQTRCCGGFGHKLLFPEDVQTSIQKVIETFDGLQQKMRDREDINNLFDKILLRTPAALPFSHDKKYVPLKNTISLVQEGLTSADGPRVVTLHGGPGTGKSTLARYVALRYQDQALSSGDPSRSTGRLEKPFPDGVFFLACGFGADRRIKIAELLQNLGSKIRIEDQSQENQDQQQGAQPAAYQTESALHKKLHARLTEQSVLIILDDVWESGMIQSLLVPGKRVRYFVTTQRAGLWGDSFRIKIETPDLEEARIILLNHVQLQTGELPIHIQKIADDIIKASESNPLILANLALAIKGERATDAGEWELKRNFLLELLEAEGNDDGPVRFDVKYPRSVAASMMMAVNSLEPEAKNMLLLASLCEGPLVPENLVRVLFKNIYGRLASFIKWADYLEDRSLIQIQTQTISGSSVYCRTWSIHATRKHFILKKEKDKVMKFISAMLKDSNDTVSDSTDADLVVALCNVYVDKNLIQECQQTGVYESRADIIWVKPSIEPLVWLLELQGGKEEPWHQEAHLHARKVILRYVAQGSLDDFSIASLLELPQTASATCWALQSMALMQEQPLLISESEQTLMSLLNLLAEGGDLTTQRRAIEALGALAEKNHNYILSHQSVLETFLKLLGRNSSPVLQEGAAWAIGTLASSKESRDVLGGYAGLVETLVGLQSTSTDVHLRVRRSAAYALVQMTTELSSSKPVLEALIALLEPDVNLGVQEETTKCLAKLAGAPENQVIIASHPDALNLLFGMLVRATIPESAKRYACMCLAELSLGRESRMAIKTFPDAVVVLEGFLAEDVVETLRTLAAMCLANLRHSDLAMSLAEPLRKSLSSTAQLLMSNEEPDDNIYLALRKENNDYYRKLHMQPWPE